jgi:hypothetical protein
VLGKCKKEQIEEFGKKEKRNNIEKFRKKLYVFLVMNGMI